MGMTPELARNLDLAERRRRRADRAAAGHVLAAFARVGATRKPGRAPFDPTPAQRTGTRRHGRTRYGQRRDAAAWRHPDVQASVRRVLEAGDLRRPLELTDDDRRTLASLEHLEAPAR